MAPPDNGPHNNDHNSSDEEYDDFLEARRAKFTRNPQGNNGHARPTWTEAEFASAVGPYLLSTNFNQRTIRDLLATKHGIVIGRSKYYTLINKLAIVPDAALSSADEVRHVEDFLRDDPVQAYGVRRVYDKLALRGIKITRDRVAEIMAILDPPRQSFVDREPGAKKIHGDPGSLVTIGPNEEWAGDGHDQLLELGFPIYGIRDLASTYYLSLATIPSHKSPEIPGYLFLLAVREAGGVPIQYTTDRGSETRDGYALQTALRETFAPDIDLDLIPAYRFLKSVYNITIERGWKSLRNSEIKNIKYFWEQGKNGGVFRAGSESHRLLARYLFLPLVRKVLDEYMQWNNFHRVRKQVISRPSGASPYEVYNLPLKFGLKNQIIPVDLKQIDALLAKYPPDILEFGPRPFREHCDTLYENIGRPEITVHTVWDIFARMLAADVAIPV